MSTVKTNNVQIGQSVTATNNFTWYQPSSPDGTVRLGNGNSGSVTDLVTLTSAGNLGIGTSSPGQKLDVAGSGRFLTPNSGTTGAVILRDDATNASSGYLQWVNNASSVQYGWIKGLSGTGLAFSATGSENMRLDSSGNLGLGVTPSAWDSTYKAMQLGSGGNQSAIAGQTNTNQLNIVSNGYFNGTNWIYGNSVGSALYRQSINQHQWFTAPSGTAGNAISFTQAMTLDASGNLLVGTTTQANNAKVTVFSDNTTAGGVAVASSASLYRQIYLTSTGTVLQFWNGTNQANLSAAGAWTNASDARLKKDIVDIKYGLSTVLASEPRSFNRVDTDGEYIGFIAQELKKLVPEVVFGSDAEGDQYTVDYGSLVAVAFKAIQELSAELNELKQKVK